MNRYGLTFHHMGLVTREPNQAVKFLEGMGYNAADPVYDPEQKVNLIMCTATDMPDFEVIYSSGEPGPLDNLLKKQQSTIYHTCYTSENIEESIKVLKQDGLSASCVAPPRNAVMFGNKEVSFYIIDGFGIIEIIDNSA